MNKELDDLRLRDTEIVPNDFLTQVTHHCIDIMNRLSKILSDSMQCKVRACIKLNDFTKENETNPENINLITFARSGTDGLNAAIREQSKK